MQPSEAAARVAQQWGVSTSDVEVISVELVNVETHQTGNSTITTYTYKVTFRLTDKGWSQATNVISARVGENWTPDSEYRSLFQREFGGIKGSEKVLDRFSGKFAFVRIGAKHEADIALKLGKWLVREFQASYKASTLGLGYIDIVTKHNIAVEGKGRLTNDFVSAETIDNAARQAINRLIPPKEGAPFRGVIVVFPNETLRQVRANIAFWEQKYPGMRICELSEVRKIYEDLVPEVRGFINRLIDRLR